MSKKAVVSLILTGLLVLLVTSTVLAAPPTPEPGVKKVDAVGQITSIGENQFTIKTILGQEKSITIDENTRYISRQGKMAFSDLEVGRWVILRAGQQGENPSKARVVVLMPEGFNPKKRLENRHIGTVQSVDTHANILTIKTTKEDSLSFLIDQDTKFLGSKAVTSLSSLPINRWVVVQGEVNEDGNELARFILILPENFSPNNPQNVRTGGTIQSLDLVKNTFSLLTPKSETMIFKVDENTSFLGRGNKVAKLGDLQTNMRVLVLGYKETDGSIIALMVAAGQPGSINDGSQSINIPTLTP